MFARRTGRFVLVVAMSATITAVADHHLPTASAQDPQVLISAPPVVGSGGSSDFQVTSLGGSTTVVNPGGTTPVTQLCVPTPDTDGESFCLGASDKESDQNDVTPVNISGFATQPAGLPDAAMAWLVDDAETAVALQHGVRLDDLVRTYARPEIRAYIASRILNILNKKLYGQPLTDQEEGVYEAMAAVYKQRQVDQATQALTEYSKWNADPCAYVPPNPPAGSGLPVVPNDVSSSGACLAGGLSQAFKFTNGTPPVSTFDTWAAYRHPTASMNYANNTTFRSMSVANASAIALAAGTGLALTAGGAGGFGAVVDAASEAAVEADASLDGLSAADIFADLVPSIGALAGGVAASVTAVIGGIVIGAIAIYQLVEDQKPGQDINQRAQDAVNNPDPLAITSQQAAYSGLDFATLQDPSGTAPAFIHSSDFYSQILAQVDEWMSFTQGGTLIPDPTTGYTDDSTADDYQFLVNGVPQSFIQLLAPQGAIGRSGTVIEGYRVRFSHGWLMVAEVAADGTVGAYSPRLSVNYVDASGNNGQMTLINHGASGSTPQLDFQLTKPADGTETASFATSWTFKSNAGETRTVTLQTAPPVLPQINVVPSAEGDMDADHIVTIESNASTDTPTVGTSYTWDVERLDDSGNPVEKIPVADGTIGFQHRFTTPGRYRAEVTASGNNGAPFSASGRVEFTIQQPEPEILSSDIRDSRTLDGALSLNLDLSQNTSSDVFDVAVDWATDGAGNTVTKHYTVQCVDTGSDTCNTGTLVAPDDAPTNPQWSESPTFTIPATQNYLPYVNVTITNSYGQVIKRAFPITPGDNRPTYDSTIPDVSIPAATGNANYTVDVVQVHPATLPSGADQTLTIQPYFDQIIDQLPAGLRPDIEQKPNGEWWLEIKGSPSADSIGTHSFYFPFEQEPIGSNLRPPAALVNLEVSAAVQPGYRAVLRDVPAAFTDRSYRNVYPDYKVQVAQVLDTGQTAFTPFTGTVMCKLVSGPQTVFDKPCAANQEFPWPTQRITDPNLTATVYLESATQTLSTDGPSVASLATRFVDPQVSTTTPAAAAARQTFTLRLDDNGIVLPPYTGYTVTCSQDGKAYASCFGSSKTISLLRVPGKHTLDVRVKAPDGATSTTVVGWTVSPTARTLGLKVPTGKKKRGTKVTLTGSLLLPGEAYVVKIGGIVVGRGTATSTGTFSKRVKIPKRLKARKYSVVLIGATSTRKVTRTIRLK
ncbi:MAG TPA: hypothetical protein VFE15_16945 [Marmoricola sp.]|jgi:hypothetical protein|nr:hypothetical protein [Marmoricola sp.]